MQKTITNLLRISDYWLLPKKKHIQFTRPLLQGRNCSKFHKMTSEAGVSLPKVLEALEGFAPLSLSEKWDNTGLLIEPFTPRPITKILLTNDLLENVVREAYDLDVEMIISYHPPIFAPLKSITQRTWKERIISALLERRIALFSPHTSWDSVQGGVNDWLASCFNYQSSVPITEGPALNTGCGRILLLNMPVSIEQVVHNVKALTGLSHVRIALAQGISSNALVESIALCAGSGTSVLKDVKADLFLTGEMLHHDILNATNNGTSVILTNHSDSERGFLKIFSSKLEELLHHQVKIMVSKKDADPLSTM